MASRQKSSAAVARSPHRAETAVGAPEGVIAPADRGDAGYSFGVAGLAKDAYPNLPAGTDYVRVAGSSEVQWLRFPEPLTLSESPGPWTLPGEVLGFKPENDTIFKYFFKGTSKEVKIRQIFFHTPLTAEEEGWLTSIRDYCRWKNFPIDPSAEPLLLRICYFNKRKFGDRYVVKSYDHLKEALNWRGKYFPFSDSDPEIVEDLKNGVLYWAARDEKYRPLLIIRLKRMSRHASPERFKKLVVFAFEWAMRYIFVPGCVETCTVLFDVRGIAVHSFPMSALSDMTQTLTRQYPFRLDRMFIINDSLFIQTVWQIAKQFLTEVQQQKMNFMRTGFEKELLKSYAPHHLESEFGGTRAPITSFYPFPLEPGPFVPSDHSRGDTSQLAHCWKALDLASQKGRYWEGADRPQYLFDAAEAPKIFKALKLPAPAVRGEDVKTATVSQMSNVSSAAIPVTPTPSAVDSVTSAGLRGVVSPSTAVAAAVAVSAASASLGDSSARSSERPLVEALAKRADTASLTGEPLPSLAEVLPPSTDEQTPLAPSAVFERVDLTPAEKNQLAGHHFTDVTTVSETTREVLEDSEGLISEASAVEKRPSTVRPSTLSSEVRISSPPTKLGTSTIPPTNSAPTKKRRFFFCCGRSNAIREVKD